MLSLRHRVSLAFPSAEMFLSRPQSPDNYCFLSICMDQKEIAIEYKEGDGYGFSYFDETSDDLDGLFAAPQEFYINENQVFERIKEKLS